MTRFISLAACTFIATAALFAASRAETTTYVDGNLTGVSPNTGGTLVFSDEKAMLFRTGLATIEIPYAGITKAELGATKTNSHDVPLYKVWALHKRFGSKTETQFLVVEFKDEEGAAKTMTLEVAQASASGLLANIQSHSKTAPAAEVASAAPAPAVTQTPTPAAAPAKVKADKPATTAAKSASNSTEDWWGDSIWKTTRNADKWNKPAGTNAPEEQ